MTSFHGKSVINNQEVNIEIKFFFCLKFFFRVKSGKLVSIQLNEKSVWVTYKNDDDELKISFVNLNGIDGACDLIMEYRDDKDDEITFSKDIDHKEAYLKAIFEPFRFSKLTICKALNVCALFRRQENNSKLINF